MLTAFLADLLAVNRRLMEDVQYRNKKIEVSRQRLSFFCNSTQGKQIT